MDDYKCAVILENGNIEKFGDSRSDEIHAICLLENGRRLHPNNNYFKMLNENHLFSTIAYYFTEANDITFINVTSYRKEELRKYGRRGIFFLPSVITKEQIESLKVFAEDIKDFDIELKSDFSIVDGILEYKTIRPSESEVKVDLVTLIKRNCLVNDSNYKR